MRIVGYTERARFYDVEYNSSADHLFLAQLITEKVQSILEIPSGAGRNIEWLAKTGRRVVAADIEPAMLRHVNQRIGRCDARDRIFAVKADMCNFNFGEKFDLILVPQEGLQLLTRKKDVTSALCNFAKHLNTNGTLVIDLANFDSSIPAHAQHHPDYYDPTLPDGLLFREWTRKISSSKTLSRSRIQYHRKAVFVVEFIYSVRNRRGKEALYRSKVKLKHYNLEGFLKLLEVAGLKLRKAMGDYAGSPYKAGSARMILLIETR